MTLSKSRSINEKSQLKPAGFFCARSSSAYPRKNPDLTKKPGFNSQFNRWNLLVQLLFDRLATGFGTQSTPKTEGTS